MTHAPKPEQLASEESLNDAALIKAVHPSIEFVRREIFGSETVPFPTLSKSIEWIESAPPPKSRLGAKQTRQLDRLVSEATDGLGGVEIRIPFVSYWKRHSNTVHRIGAAPGSAQATLGAQAEAIATGTGWHAAEVVMWILAGREPDPVPDVHYRVKWRVTPLPAGGNLRRKTVVLEVHNLGLTDTEWRRVRKGIRKEFRRDGKQSLRKKDRILYDVVQELGGKAAEGETWAAHWDAIAKVCNHRSGDPTWCKNHRSTYMLWRRLRPKLQEIQEHSWSADSAKQPPRTS